MHDFRDIRGTSDNEKHLYSRNYPDTRCIPTSQPFYMMNTADNGLQLQGVGQACPHSLAAMPFFSHEQCNRGQPHETCTWSHGQKSQYHPDVGACCPYLPHLGLPSASIHTNQRSMDRVSHLSHKPMPAVPGYQNQSSSYTIGHDFMPTQYNMSPSFVPTFQSTMPHQQTDNMTIDVRDFQSQVSTTPRLSHVTTPESVFSAPRRPESVRNGSREIGTPASAASIGNIASTFTGTISPAQMFSTRDGYSNGSDESSFHENWVSDLHGDNQDWLHDNDFHHTQPQAYDNVDTQEQHSSQYKIHPHVLAHGTNLQLSSQESISGPTQAFPKPMADTVINWDSVLGFQDFPVPPSFDDLNGEIFEADDGVSLTNRPITDSYEPAPSVYSSHFDFKPPRGTTSAYKNGHNNHALTLLSNGFDLSRSGTDGTGGQGRPAVHDANKDALLVRMRREGKSYKEIMATKMFGLQESTLRGRYRTLTKNKEQRVRKPAWSQSAVCLWRYIF